MRAGNHYKFGHVLMRLDVRGGKYDEIYGKYDKLSTIETKDKEKKVERVDGSRIITVVRERPLGKE